MFCNSLVLEDMQKNSIKALGNQYKETTTKAFTSSSGGAIYTKAFNFAVLKNGKKVENPNLENYLMVNIKKDVFSSSGIIYYNISNVKSMIFKQIEKSDQTEKCLSKKTPKRANKVSTRPKVDPSFYQSTLAHIAEPRRVRRLGGGRGGLKDTSSPASRFEIVMDQNSILVLNRLEFENVNIEIDFDILHDTISDPLLESIWLNKNSSVVLSYPDYYSVKHLEIVNSNLTIEVSNVLVVSDFFNVTNGFFQVDR